MAFPLLGVLGAISGLGGILGGGAKAAADGRMKEADIHTRQDNTLTAQYGIGQDAQMDAGSLDLQRKNFTEDARGGRAKQAMLADMLMNFKPTSIDIPGIQSAKVSGGMQMGEGGRMAAGEMLKQALMAQLSGDKFEGGNILKAPGVQAIPKAGLLEKIGGIAGTVGAVAGGLGQVLPSFGVGGGGMAQVPGIPGGMTGMPGQMPGQTVGGVQIPDNSALTPEIIAQINAITNRSGGGGF
jgi:hypothetical protein